MNNDLISRKALKKAFEDCTGECACCVHNTNDFEYCGLIDNAPTVSPNQGKWIDHTKDFGYVECPICGHKTYCKDNIDELHYCWNCGARMKGGAE